MTTKQAAKRLTEAQRRAILDSPKEYRVHIDTRTATLNVLERLGITEGNTSLCLTPLGIAVRAILLADEQP